MAKFPTQVESSVTVKAPIEKVYKYLWDVVGSSQCIPGLASCKKAGKDTYRFVYDPRSVAGISLTVTYTAAYRGDGKGRIGFAGSAGADDNTDVAGELKLAKISAGRIGAGTKITLTQTLAPDTPVPSLLQRLVKSFAEKEASGAAQEYLANLKQALEGKKA